MRAFVRQWRLVLISLMIRCLSLPLVALLTFHHLGPVRIGELNYAIHCSRIKGANDILANIPQGGDRYTVSGLPTYYEDHMWYRLGSWYFAVHVYKNEQQFTRQ